MSDPNLLAILIPCGGQGLAKTSFALDANAHCYHHPANGNVEEPTDSNWKNTHDPQWPAIVPTHNSIPPFLVKFDNKPKDPSKGWLLGTDPCCADFLLPKTAQGVSGRHLYLTVNDSLSVEVHDNSSFGTSVRFDSRAEDKIRKKEKCVLSLEPGRRFWPNIIVYLPGPKGLAFQIVLPNHEAGCPEYIANLKSYLRESRNALPPVATLGLGSKAATAALSHVSNFPQRPIYNFVKLIGKGAFGEVHQVLNAITGDFYAAKKFYNPFQGQKGERKRMQDEHNDNERWLKQIRNEITIMRLNPHPNIMEVIEFREIPEPILYMPYYHLGNLENHKSVSFGQKLSAFRQVLLGLNHLHGRQIVHRDLKPENIIVATLDPFIIKIADFGLSKDLAKSSATTFCGTPMYIAPEVVDRKGGKELDCTRDHYGVSTDIWSTGVIFLKLVYDFPAGRERTGTDFWDWNHWYKRWVSVLVEKVNDSESALVEKVNDSESAKLKSLLSQMVRIEQYERLTAKQCLKIGCRLGLFRKQNGMLINAGEKMDGEISVRADTSDNESSFVISDDVSSDDDFPDEDALKGSIPLLLQAQLAQATRQKISCSSKRLLSVGPSDTPGNPYRIDKNRISFTSSLDGRHATNTANDVAEQGAEPKDICEFIPMLEAPVEGLDPDSTEDTDSSQRHLASSKRIRHDKT